MTLQHNLLAKVKAKITKRQIKHNANMRVDRSPLMSASLRFIMPYIQHKLMRISILSPFTLCSISNKGNNIFNMHAFYYTSHFSATISTLTIRSLLYFNNPFRQTFNQFNSNTIPSFISPCKMRQRICLCSDGITASVAALETQPITEWDSPRFAGELRQISREMRSN